MISLVSHIVAEKRRETGRNVRVTARQGLSPWPPGAKSGTHLGTDMGGLLRKTPMELYLEGEILYAGKISHIGSYGNTLFLHPKLYPEYVIQVAHAHELLCKTGDTVKYGQNLYTQGGSGQKGLYTYGVHTHLEVRRYEPGKKPWDMRNRLDPETPLFNPDHLQGKFEDKHILAHLILLNGVGDWTAGEYAFIKQTAPVAVRGNADHLIPLCKHLIIIGGTDIEHPNKTYLSGKNAKETLMRVLEWTVQK